MSRRLLLLNTDLELGGTPTVVRELAKRLNEVPELSVEVACLSAGGPVAEHLREAGIEVTAFGARRAIELRGVVRQLVELIQSKRIDVVFSFLMHANAVAAMARGKCEARFIQSIQTTQPYPRWHWWVQRFAQRAAERIVVPSASVARAAQQRAGVPEGEIVIIPNAIDLADFTPSALPASDVRPFPIGFLGRLDPVKRVGDLVSAVGRLGDLVHLHIFGDGPERGAIEAMVRSLRLHDRVTLHGAVSRPQEALAMRRLPSCLSNRLKRQNRMFGDNPFITLQFIQVHGSSMSKTSPPRMAFT